MWRHVRSHRHTVVHDICPTNPVGQVEGRTDCWTDTTKHIISPAWRSIIRHLRSMMLHSAMPYVLYVVCLWGCFCAVEAMQWRTSCLYCAWSYAIFQSSNGCNLEPWLADKSSYRLLCKIWVDGLAANSETALPNDQFILISAPVSNAVVDWRLCRKNLFE